MDTIENYRKERLKRDAAAKDFPGGNATSEDILALLAKTQALRDDAIGLGLKFEGYLLDLAVIALHERAQK